jgi:ribulose 1,5-bisphosphate synthetase/thiazole synthase
MGSIHQFTIKDEPIENLRPLKVRVIGAGYSGIYLGIRIPQRLRNIDLQIYEKNEGVGGAWWENRYPGACNILLFLENGR